MDIFIHPANKCYSPERIFIRSSKQYICSTIVIPTKVGIQNNARDCMKFSAIKDKIKNNPGLKSIKEVKEAGYRIVKERDGDRYFLARQGELKPLLVRLGDIAEVRFGIKTGANEFFYLDEERLKEWKIEKEFLKPIIKSPRECKSIR